MSAFSDYERENLATMMVAEKYETQQELSESQFNAVVGGLTAYGLLVNALMCKFTLSIWLGINPIVLVIAYFILCFAGIFVMHRATSPALSFVGYNMIVIPVGAMVTLATAYYAEQTVTLAFATTGAITFAMMAISTAFPQTFLRMGPALAVSLLCAIVGSIVMSLVAAFTGAYSTGAATLFDYAFVVIFTLFIGYDWARIGAMTRRTTVSAMDCAASLFLDVINLFLRLLSIFGRNNRNN